MDRLISMTDFVIQQQNNKVGLGIKQIIFDYSIILKYAQFLKQPLTLGMFVPDDEGNILQKPSYYEEWLEDEEFIFSIDGVAEQCVKYNKAKEKVLFEGFEYKPMYEKPLSGYIIMGENTDSIYPFPNINNYTVEDLIKFQPLLTELALKQIGL